MSHSPKETVTFHGQLSKYFEIFQLCNFISQIKQRGISYKRDEFFHALSSNPTEGGSGNREPSSAQQGSTCFSPMENPCGLYS